jgi:hypothetical protein
MMETCQAYCKKEKENVEMEKRKDINPCLVVDILWVML